MPARPLNQVDVTSRQPTTALAMFNERWRHAAGHEFVIELSGRTFTYGQIAAAAHAVGDGLDGLGLRRGDVVGVYMSNRAGWVVSSLGCWSRGLTVAAVNRMIPPESAAHELEVSKARAVCLAHPDVDGDGIGDLASLPTLPVDLPGAATPPHGTHLTHGTMTAHGTMTEPEPEPEPQGGDDAVIVFTSGTTGQPKALLSTHARLMEAARQQARSYARTPSFHASVAPTTVAPIVSFTAFGHLAGYASLAFSLWTGRRLALVDKFSVEATKELVERYRLSALRLNPAAILMLATTEIDIDMSHLRYVYSGTAPLSAKAKELFTQRYGIPILQGYGQSETGPIALSRYDDVVSGREPPGSVGRVLDEVAIRIADHDDRPLAPPAEGEIQVKTAQAAVAEGSTLSVTSDGFIRTGDIGRMDPDGFLWVTGRTTEKMVVGGFNVFPTEVEEVLRRSDLVRDAIVVGLPDDRLGERPAAGVVWEGRPDHEALEQFARGKLAAYKVPRQWFDLDRIPLTVRGKVDRREALSIARSLLLEP